MASQILLERVQHVLPGTEVIEAIPLYQGRRRPGAPLGAGASLVVTGPVQRMPFVGRRTRWFTLVQTPTHLVVLVNRRGHPNRPVEEIGRYHGIEEVAEIVEGDGPLVLLGSRWYRIPDTLLETARAMIAGQRGGN